MAIWAFSDLHLALGNPAKTMARFPGWENYVEKIEQAWREVVVDGDLVLVAGDISWASKLEEVETDLRWLDSLPGKKVLSNGNHDYWWSSEKKMNTFLKERQFKSIHFLFNTPFIWKDQIIIAGTRLWDSEEYSFGAFIDYKANSAEREKVDDREHDRAIFKREIEKLARNLAPLKGSSLKKIAMLHYPPINAALSPSQASAILESAGIDLAIFGHLHSVRKGALPFGTKNGVTYLLTSADYIDFNPLLLLNL